MVPRRVRELGKISVRTPTAGTVGLAEALLGIEHDCLLAAQREQALCDPVRIVELDLVQERYCGVGQPERPVSLDDDDAQLRVEPDEILCSESQCFA